MKENDRVIYDSGFGYDVAIFKRVGIFTGDFIIQLCSGVMCGNELSVSMHDVRVYSTEFVKRLTEKYGYEKAFSEVF